MGRLPADWRVVRWHFDRERGCSRPQVLSPLDVSNRPRGPAPAARSSLVSGHLGATETAALPMVGPMFRITTQTAGGELVLKLEGYLAGPWVHELDTCWRDAVTAMAGRPVRIDLTALWRVDAAGRELMAEMHRAGAQFVATGCVMPEVVREISEARS